MDILAYDFFQRAAIGLAILSIAWAIIGTYIVTRRLVALSGGVTHACFGGLGLGYFLGINPLATAALFAIAASSGVEWMSRSERIREDSAIAVVWALGMATGIIFVFLTPGYVPELNTFLFGNVLLIGWEDIIWSASYTLILTTVYTLLYRKIISCAFDSDFARITGIPVGPINYLMTIFVALCIVLTIRLAGIMLLMSMISIPVIIAEKIFTRYRSILLGAWAIALITSLGGLALSAFVNVPCSALIVLLLTALYIIVRIIKH